MHMELERWWHGIRPCAVCPYWHMTPCSLYIFTDAADLPDACLHRPTPTSSLSTHYLSVRNFHRTDLLR